MLGLGEFGLPCIEQYDNTSRGTYPQKASSKDTRNGRLQVSFGWLLIFDFMQCQKHQSQGEKYNLQLDFSIAPTKLSQSHTTTLK